MKIIKENLKSKRKLNEADNKIDIDAETKADAEQVIKDPEKADLDDIADAVEAGVAVETNGAVDLTDKQANDAAEVVQKVASKIDDIEYTPASENLLTKVLDKALEVTLHHLKRGTGSGKNVLITGLPGSGKTAIVYDWAARQNPPVNIFYLDAKNPDLEAFINGYTVKDATRPDENRVTQAFSDNLDPLERPNSILFLDELNRQTQVNIRGSLYSLINEHVIAGKNKTGRRHFDNLLFTVACINPVAASDEGASPLSDAEISRFAFNINFDSNIESAVDYIDKHYRGLIYKKRAEIKDKKSDDYQDTIAELLRSKALGLYIVQHPKFDFDTSADLDDLAANHIDPKDMLNMRTLQEAIECTYGYKDNFLDYIHTFNQKFLPRDIEMFETILDDYTDPIIEYHRDGSDPEIVQSKRAGGLYSLDDVEEDEIDSTLFADPITDADDENAQADTGRKAINKDDLVKAVQNFNW